MVARILLIHVVLIKLISCCELYTSYINLILAYMLYQTAYSLFMSILSISLTGSRVGALVRALAVVLPRVIKYPSKQI